MYVHISIPTYGLTKREQSKLKKAISVVNKALSREGLEQRAATALSYGNRSKKPRRKVVAVPMPVVPPPVPEKPKRVRKPRTAPMT